jgi:hypothetical protein
LKAFHHHRFTRQWVSVDFSDRALDRWRDVVLRTASTAIPPQSDGDSGHEDGGPRESDEEVVIFDDACQ